MALSIAHFAHLSDDGNGLKRVTENYARTYWAKAIITTSHHHYDTHLFVSFVTGSLAFIHPSIDSLYCRFYHHGQEQGIQQKQRQYGGSQGIDDRQFYSKLPSPPLAPRFFRCAVYFVQAPTVY
jgi:hypothetical protein